MLVVARFITLSKTRMHDNPREKISWYALNDATAKALL